eukprot:scaffold85774_cov21-Tisochrysis_lutea.AAC.3
MGPEHCAGNLTLLLPCRFQPQALSNLLWGLGHFKVCDQELLSLLAREAVYKVDDLKPLGITTILEAWAHAG